MVPSISFADLGLLNALKINVSFLFVLDYGMYFSSRLSTHYKMHNALLSMLASTLLIVLFVYIQL